MILEIVNHYYVKRGQILSYIYGIMNINLDNYFSYTVFMKWKGWYHKKSSLTNDK